MAKWFCRRRIAAVLLVAIDVFSVFAAATEEYDRLCGQITQGAKDAASLYNGGRQAEAFAALDGVRASFRAAKKLLPSEPQAYVDMATSMLNSQQFDEAIDAWKGARKRTKDPGIREWIDSRLRWTRFGKVSVRRDRTYALGQGNLTAALRLIKKQLAIYPESPWLMHDLATVYVLASSPDVPGGREALSHAEPAFIAAQNASWGPWRSGVLARGRGGPLCQDDISADEGAEGAAGAAGLGGGIVYDWPSWFAREGPRRGPLVELQHVAGGGDYGVNKTYRDHGAYVARFQDVGISGDDGLIVDEARCLVFAASAGPFVRMPGNLQMLQTWMPRSRLPGASDAEAIGHDWYDSTRGGMPEHGLVAKPRQLDRAASIVQFASKSHFHVITELAARLALLNSSGVLEQDGMQLVAPVDPREGRGFITAILRTMAGKLMQEQRVLWWGHGRPDVRLQVGTLYYADWRLPAPMGEDGGLCATPRSALLQARDALLAGLRDGPAKSKSRTVVFLTRKRMAEKEDMRTKLEGEATLRKKIEEAAKSAPLKLAVKEFDGSLSPAGTVALFSRAFAVVGVHGGALSNIIFCPGSAEIFEMGFASPYAGHYRHLAAAMGLRATLLPLVADEGGMGSHKIRLVDPEGAAAAIRARLLLGEEGGAAHSSIAAEARVADRPEL